MNALAKIAVNKREEFSFFRLFVIIIPWDVQQTMGPP